MTSFEILQILMGTLGTLGFAILFNIRSQKLLFAVLGGFLSWTLFVLLKFITPSEPIRYFFVSVFISAYAEAMARLIKTPSTTFLMTSLIPLIPGGALYYTMSAVFSMDLDAFLEKGVYTLSLAVSLALGSVLTSAAVRFFKPIKKNR